MRSKNSKAEISDRFCGNKTVYGSIEMASRAASVRELAEQTHYHIYHCRSCAGWHIGHKESTRTDKAARVIEGRFQEAYVRAKRGSSIRPQGTRGWFRWKGARWEHQSDDNQPWTAEDGNFTWKDLDGLWEIYGVLRP